jgi:hypothetical protein
VSTPKDSDEAGHAADLVIQHRLASGTFAHFEGEQGMRSVSRMCGYAPELRRQDRPGEQEARNEHLHTL